MNWVFDIDGTISENPSVFGKLMKALKDSGERVVVMTGALDPESLDKASVHLDFRKNQLMVYGIIEGIHYDELEVIIGKTVLDVAKGKGRRCGILKAEMVFEDSPLYISEIRKASPSTTTLLVTQ